MSFSEFTQKDRDLIQRAYEALREAARQRCRSDKELEVIHKAFLFANEAHKNVRRRSGEPYMLHPIAVAQIVVSDIGLGYKSIAAALLHDIVEDTAYTVDDIRKLFGDKIAQLVDGMTKIKSVLDNEELSVHTESLQAENFKRILLTMGDDMRVVLIKLADRLHNCRTIEYMPEHKRDKILSETMFIFIPLANRLGLYGIKSEMENIWLRFKEPEDYAGICSRISENVASRENEIDAFIAPIRSALDRMGCHYEIKKRIKTPYSIWRKMRFKNVPFDQIYDLYAVRIIFDPDKRQARNPEAEREIAFSIYSAITRLYRENPGRKRDWLSQPKSNGYEALHCTLRSKTGIWVEVQIRSRRMDDIAEKGIAAHWAYKREGYVSENDVETDRWLRQVQEILTSKDLNALELLDIVHSDLMGNEIVVFTPKGEQRNIPKGATALDFAFRIHTGIGEKAIAAKVNMRLAPLSQVLKAGDQVEIITAQNARPKVAWLNFLQTRHARRLVYEYIRDREPDQLPIAENILALQRVQAIDNMRSTVIEMTDGQTYEIAACCNPIPGDPVIGFRKSDGRIVIHKKSCRIAEGLAATHGERIIIPQWPAKATDFPVRISLKGIDRKGLLNEITRVISLEMDINIRKLTLGADEGIFEGFIDLMVQDKTILDKMVGNLKLIDGIQEAVRTDL